MDHHDEWGQWHPDDDPGLGDGDTADLGPDAGGHDLGDHDLGDHDLGGHDEYGDHDPYPAGHDLTPGPDLVHEGGDLHPGDLHPGDLGPHDLDLHDAGQAHTDQAHSDQPVDDQPAPTDHLVGADPDLPADAHAGWHEGYFPPALDLDVRPQPTDGYPWADPDVLGDAGTDHGTDQVSDQGIDHSALAGGAAVPGDLFAYAGLQPVPPGTDPWAHLLASDDPATSTLARFWGPE